MLVLTVERNWRCLIVCLAGSLVMLSASVAAQTTPCQTIPRGARIRVSLTTSPEKSVVGIADTLRGDWLRWWPAGLSADSLRLSAIDRLELSQGRRSNTGRGAVIGGATIGTLGLLVFGAMASAPEGDIMRLERGWRDGLLLTGGAAAAGAIAGALVGSMFSSEHWQDIPLGGVRVAPVSLGRFGVGVSLRL